MPIKFEDEPKESREPSKEPGAVQQFATGAVRGLLGTPGDIEKLLTRTAPEFLGVPPAFQREKLFGRETILPTSEEVGKGLEYVGVPNVPSFSRSAGEVVGGFGTALPSLARGTKAAFESGVSRLLRGKETAAAQERLATEAARAQQRGLGQIETTRAASEAAKEAERRAGRRGESALRDLAGVRVTEEAGRFRPIPAGKTEVGNIIRSEADKFVTNIKQARNAKADELFGQAAGEARAYSQLGQFVDTRPVISKIDDLLSKGGTEDYMNSLRRLRNDIERTKNFEGLEVIRRKLGDAAFGAPEEGYKAISQQFAGDMREAVTQAMRDFSKTIGGKTEGAFGRYLDEYKRLSENLRVYGTKTGRGILETEGVGGQYFAKTGEKIADEMFSSPENYRKFVDAVGGNKQITEAAARRYFAGLLEGKTKPQDVEKVIKDYRDVLKEMPTIRTEIEGRYLAPVRQQATRAEAAAGRQLTEKELAKAQKDLSDSVRALTDIKPTEVADQFNNKFLPALRKLESDLFAGTGRAPLKESDIEKLRQLVMETQKIADKTQRARIIGSAVAGLLGATGLTRTGSAVMGE